jgi:hypothetical protein
VASFCRSLSLPFTAVKRWSSERIPVATLQFHNQTEWRADASLRAVLRTLYMRLLTALFLPAYWPMEPILYQHRLRMQFLTGKQHQGLTSCLEYKNS